VVAAITVVVQATLRENALRGIAEEVMGTSDENQTVLKTHLRGEYGVVYTSPHT